MASPLEFGHDYLVGSESTTERDDAGASLLLERLEAYDPESDHSEPLKHRDILRRFPYPSTLRPGLTTTWVSKFATLAYCPYKIWHGIRGTPEIRPRRVQIAVDKGKTLHAEKEAVLTAEAAKAKPATTRELRDPSVDLVELPEIPAKLQRGTWLYLAKLDGLARLGGDLVVRERKTGRWAQMPDHLLQVWAYSIAAPGALSFETKGALRSRGIAWEVQYPTLEETWGPFLFRATQFELVTDAMAFFENVATRSVAEDGLDLGWSPVAGKCGACGFAHSCNWKPATVVGPGSRTSRLVDSRESTSVHRSLSDWQ